MLPPEKVPAVLDAAPDAMIVIDKTGTVVFANRQVSALFGYAPAELVGANIDSLLPERLRATHVTHREHYGAHARVRPMGIGLDLLARRRDGSEFPVEISLGPIGTDADLLIAAAIRDVTERRQVQAELQKAREAADSANLTKSRFLATASHDLRQPLQTLALLNGAMRRSNPGTVIGEALAQQEQAIGAMTRLLNALLDISKLESGATKPEVTDFPVASVLSELRAEFAELATAKGIELEIDSCEDRVRSDPSLLGQILRNLLSNAIKFTREGRVLLRCIPELTAIRLDVLDTGIGIPPQDVPHIFEEFYQVGVPANASRQGYGLGLSIVRRLVDLLGLRIDIRSELGSGTEFSLVLPRGASSLEASGSETHLAPTLPQRADVRRAVLLIEDDPAVRRATQLLLKVAGYDTITAATRQEALEHAQRRPDLDLVVADYHLAAGETGLQVIDALRHALNKSIKAVLITGDTSSAVQLVAHDSRTRIASKPINADAFLTLLEELLAT